MVDQLRGSEQKHAGAIHDRIVQLHQEAATRDRWTQLLGLPSETIVDLIDEANALRDLARQLEYQIALLGA